MGFVARFVEGADAGDGEPGTGGGDADDGEFARGFARIRVEREGVRAVPRRRLARHRERRLHRHLHLRLQRGSNLRSDGRVGGAGSGRTIRRFQPYDRARAVLRAFPSEFHDERRGRSQPSPTDVRRAAPRSAGRYIPHDDGFPRSERRLGIAHQLDGGVGGVALGCVAAGSKREREFGGAERVPRGHHREGERARLPQQRGTAEVYLEGHPRRRAPKIERDDFRASVGDGVRKSLVDGARVEPFRRFGTVTAAAFPFASFVFPREREPKSHAADERDDDGGGVHGMSPSRRDRRDDPTPRPRRQRLGNLFSVVRLAGRRAPVVRRIRERHGDGRDGKGRREGRSDGGDESRGRPRDGAFRRETRDASKDSRYPSFPSARGTRGHRHLPRDIVRVRVRRGTRAHLVHGCLRRRHRGVGVSPPRRRQFQANLEVFPGQFQSTRALLQTHQRRPEQVVPSLAAVHVRDGREQSPRRCEITRVEVRRR